MKQKDFLNHLNNESNHRILLWHALNETNGISGDSIGIDLGLVVEFGSGHGSTPFLKDYCNSHKREFKSFENNREWSEKTGSQLITNFNFLPQQHCGVLFIDHAPGEQRKFDIKKNKNSALIIIAHDTEKPADHGYQMRDVILNNFIWSVEINTPGGGAGAAMFSNHVDLNHLIGETWEKFTITNFIP